MVIPEIMAKRLEDLAKKYPDEVLQFLCGEGVGRDGDFDPDSGKAELPPMPKKAKAKLFHELAEEGNHKQHHKSGDSMHPEMARRYTSRPGPPVSFRKQEG